MINQKEYKKRRNELMEKVGTHALVMVPSSHEVFRNGDAVYPFRQNSDFYYLTGFSEPDAVLVLLPNRKEGEYILFNRVRDQAKEIWDGPRAGQEIACKDYLADQSFPIQEFKEKLPELLAQKETVYYPFECHASFKKLIFQALHKIRSKIRSGVHAPISFVDTGFILHEMRLIKSDSEIIMMQRAVDISERAHINAMKACRPKQFEYELEAVLQYEFIKQGGTYAYNPIIGAGKNSCILHYVNNNQEISDGDLVLIDAGAEFQCYASDITRTFPANGHFSGEQRAIYELVLGSQLKAIENIKPNVTWDAAQKIIVKVITQGLIDLGLLKGPLDSLIEQEAYLPFYMHQSGHWLGLDVHDAGPYKINNKWRPLQAGMTLTVEPGIYIPAKQNVDARWHHIGVRIEDNVLVTQDACRVLSEKIPKNISDIENLVGSAMK